MHVPQQFPPVGAQKPHPVGGEGGGGDVVGDGGGGGLPVRLSQNPFLGFPLHTQFNAVLHSVLSRTAPQFTVGGAVGGFVGGGVVGMGVG